MLARRYDPEVNAASRYRKQYKGCDVYEPYVEENGEPVFRAVGLPSYVLYEKSIKQLRYVRGEESFAIMEAL